MRRSVNLSSLLPVYVLVLGCFLILAILGSQAATVWSENAPISNRKCVIIDAGHGGEDGGAISCTGVYESQINLEIALRLNDLLHLLGIETNMIRTTDCSVYTQGNTLSAKKLSDLKERVRIANEADNAILLSIHQNQFKDSRYSGAQVFYANTTGSKELAQEIQSGFVRALNPGSKRGIKKSDGVYLMQHIRCTGVLVECGFLSNPTEESQLRSKDYQMKICCVLAASVSNYLHGNSTA